MKHGVAILRSIVQGAIPDRRVLDAFRNDQLVRLVRHAASRVPFYRERFEEAGFRVERFRGLEDLARIPLLDKRDLQRAGSTALAEGVDSRRLVERRTTGSTGQPTRILRTWWEERLLGASRWRALHSFGARRRDRFVEIEEALPGHAGDDTQLHEWLQRLGLYRQVRVDALLEAEAIFSQIVTAAPQVVSGYAGVLHRVARVDDPRPLPRPRLVVTHSDTLTPIMRRDISEGFGAPVYEMYDCNECNVVAWQCATTSALHTSDDTVIVEILHSDGRPARPGEAGEIALTSLHSFAMPLLRYRVGDVVVRGDDRCACGTPLGTLRAVQGRMFDYFPLADGRTIHPYELINILTATAPFVVEFEFIQERKDLVGLRYLTRESPAAAEALADLDRQIGAFLGPEVQFTREEVDRIERGAGAKTRVCRSLVASEYEGSTPRG